MGFLVELRPESLVKLLAESAAKLGAIGPIHNTSSTSGVDKEGYRPVNDTPLNLKHRFDM